MPPEQSFLISYLFAYNLGKVKMPVYTSAGGGGDLIELSIATGQKTGPAEMRRHTTGAVKLMGQHALGVNMLVGNE